MKQPHHHLDSDVDQAFTRLLDALCQWERATSRDGLLLYIPEHKDEPVVISQGGKPQRLEDHVEQDDVEVIFVAAMMRRYDKS